MFERQMCDLVIFYSMTRMRFKDDTPNQGNERTDVYPVTGLFIQGLHLLLMVLSLIRQLLRERSVPSTVCFVTLLEAFCHEIPFFVGTSTQGDVVFVMLVYLVWILKKELLVKIQGLRNTKRNEPHVAVAVA